MFFVKSLTVILLATSLADASPVVVDVHKRQQACAPVHLIVARGTSEAPGDGETGSLASLVINENLGATQEAVSYPAIFFPYYQSVESGVQDFTTRFKSYTSNCPNSKIVLMGWSQGANVLLDALCGSVDPLAGSSGDPTVTIDTGKKIVAVVGYGDPGHVPGLSWDYGTSTNHGLFPRNGSCNSWAGKLHSYCDSGDPFCDSGLDISIHLGYFTKYNNAAAAWINSRISIS